MLSQSSCHPSASVIPRTFHSWSITSSINSPVADTRSKTFARETLARLSRYHWPGNVRELEHLVEQVARDAPGPVVGPEDLPPHIVATREEPFSLDFDLSRPLQEITEELTARAERAYLRRVLEKYRGRIDRVRRPLRALAS